MFPIVTIFGRVFTTYALIAIIALLLCGFVFCRFIKKVGKDDNDAIVFLLIVAIKRNFGLFLGQHLF